MRFLRLIARLPLWVWCLGFAIGYLGVCWGCFRFWNDLAEPFLKAKLGLIL